MVIGVSPARVYFLKAYTAAEPLSTGKVANHAACMLSEINDRTNSAAKDHQPMQASANEASFKTASWYVTRTKNKVARKAKENTFRKSQEIQAKSDIEPART